MSDPQINLHLVYRPQRTRFSRETMDFLRRYSGMYYPNSALSILNAFRTLIRNVTFFEGSLIGESQAYEMVHYTETRDEGSKFAITEKLLFEELCMEVSHSTDSERAVIAAYVKNPSSRTELMLASTAAIHLRDELRTDPEMWQNAQACTGVAAADFIEHICSFLTSECSKRLLVHDYTLTKGPDKTRLCLELLLPKVSSYYLRIACEFK